MSADAEMAAILSHAVANASSLTSSTQALVNSAVVTISDPVTIPSLPNTIQARGLANLDDLKFEASGTEKPGLPKFPEVVFPTMPSLIDVAEMDVDFEEELDQLSFPTFQYSSPGEAPQFSIGAPSINSVAELPSLPNMAVPPAPTLLTMTALPSVQMTVAPTEFATLDVDLDFDPAFFEQQFAHFSTSIFSGSSNLRGLDDLLVELSAMSQQAFGALFPDLIQSIGQHLIDRYKTGLAARVETQIQTGLDEALYDETSRVRAAMQDRSGWDLPVLVQHALTATMEQSLGAWAAQAQSQQTTDQWEQAQSLFEVSAALYEKLRRTIQALKARELGMVLDAHQQSIRYAQQVTEALLTAFTVENYQKYDLEFKKAESQLKLFEEQLKVQLIEHEIVFAQLEAEKAKQDQDGLLVQQYQTELQQMDAENRLLAMQVASARTELELKGLPVEIFEMQLRAFAAKIRAHEAQVGALVAEINGDTARIEAETVKIKAFEAQIDALMVQTNAKRAMIQAKKQRNDTVIEELQALVKAAMAPVEVSASRAKYQLAVYEAEARDYLADAKAALEKMRLDEEWRQEEQKGLFDAYQVTREQAVTVATKRLQVLKAIAEVNNDGAQIMAQMAGGAMSAANGIANVIFREEA